jgi:hypothetical protein
VAAAAALQLSRAHDLIRDDQFHSPVIEVDNREPASGEIDAWISDLSAESSETRRLASIRLGIAGKEARRAVPKLIEHLHDPDILARMCIAEALWEIDSSSYPVAPVLIEILALNRADSRMGAANVLGRIGRDAAGAVPALTRLLKDSRSFDRLLLAVTILRIDPANDSALSLLTHGLQSSSADVRYLSTVALGIVPLSRKLVVEESLCAAIQDSNARVRDAAYETLSQLQVRNALSRAAEARLAP